MDVGINAHAESGPYFKMFSCDDKDASHAEVLGVCAAEH